ncbi:MAG: metallophosphoesterase [Clostridia bacterium]|nr:metallophosphoesterase [Clostridia bacterium]
MARRQQYIFAENPRHGKGILIAILVVLALLTAALFTANLAMTHTVTFTREYVTISTLPMGLDNFTILHLSDLNGAQLGDHQSAVKKALGSRSSYGAVVLTGNMVGKSGNVQPVLDLLAQLPTGTPVFLLPGDGDPPLYATTAHSGLSAYSDWAQTLIDAGVIILDEPRSITTGKATIWFTPESLYTMDTVSTEKAWQNQIDTLDAQVEPLTADQAALRRTAEYQVQRMRRIRETIPTIKESHIQVAVSHLPLTRQSVAESRAWATSKVFSMSNVKLILAGGYCAGQWRIPGVGAVYVPELGFFPEDEKITGMGYLAGVWQHISPGLGASPDYPFFMPMRLFNSPGATMIVLTSTVH